MSSTSPIEVRDMGIIHQTFRRAFEESARLIRESPAPSPGRVTFLADHIDFGLTMLEHHHEGEDTILYPLLVERVPDHAARTEQIDHEHQVVKGRSTAPFRPAPRGAVRLLAKTPRAWPHRSMP